jgi:hypothetical protein
VPKREAERTCIVTREERSPTDLLRFVLGPENRVLPDLRNRLPGRGAWVTPTASAVGEAVRRRLFSRAFKREVEVSPDLAAEVDAALVRDLAGALSLANKAGAIVTGFGKVEAAIASGSIAALVHAREAAEDGRRKLAGALRKRADRPISDIPIYDDLSSDDLDMALGRVHVIHAALLAGPGGEGCLARWRRLRHFRGVDEGAGRPPDVDGRQSELGNPSGRTRSV